MRVIGTADTDASDVLSDADNDIYVAEGYGRQHARLFGGLSPNSTDAVLTPEVPPRDQGYA